MRINIRLLHKLLVSYVMLVVLPLLIILAFFYPFTTNIIKEKSSDWNEHSTEQLMHSMDIFTKYVYNLPSEILHNRDIKPYMVADNPYQHIIIMNEMKKYNVTDAFIENALLYLKDAQYFFSNKGSAYTLNDFDRRGVGYYYAQWPVSQMDEELQQLTSPMVRPVESVIVPGGHSVKLLSFVLPLPLGGEQSPGSLLILVRERTILDMMNSSGEDSNGIFIITDHDKRCLVASIGCEEVEATDFHTVLQSEQAQLQGTIEKTIHADKYLISEQVSESTGWHYIRLLPVTETIQDVRNIQYMTLLLLLIIVVITSGIVYLSLRHNYEPIKRLVDAASTLFEPTNNDKLNEIDTIHYALNQLTITRDTLDEKIKLTEPKIRDQIILELLLGQYDDWDSFCIDSSPYDIHFPYPYVTVSTVLLEQELDNGMLQYCREQLEAASSNDELMSIHIVRSTYNREFIIIFNHHKQASLFQSVEELQKQLKQQYDVDCLIGISNKHKLNHEQPQSFYVAYLQASRCLEQIRFQRTTMIMEYSDALQSSQGVISYQTELMQSLELAIIKTDVEQIEQLTKQIQSYMSNDGMLPHIRRTIYLNTMSILFNALEKHQQDNSSILNHIEFVFQHRYTLDQMLNIMSDTSRKLCELTLAALPNTARRTPSEQIIALMEEHWADPNLSLQFMADQFQMSPSNFSYHFKKSMGQNFKEYTDQLRIQQSIQLLKSTEESIEAIALQVGYINASSFIRSFKKIIGMPPGQYREQAKSSEQSMYHEQ
ncbi:helix-turn-helix domain-containing protein [Paenibacillus camelliae]|uniref:helix-turn-helix domain-containing protein n=1 Tax=Paenibacillus camelliae TaxID=512410 RepID=UPI00203B2F50|nr:AraC family transcriptional regulator [Paenibacillus camelliae]MCM3633777.1 AraC family transcriptional regulator [Paenibacillus camelliae]